MTGCFDRHFAHAEITEDSELTWEWLRLCFGASRALEFILKWQGEDTGFLIEADKTW